MSRTASKKGRPQPLPGAKGRNQHIRPCRQQNHKIDWDTAYPMSLFALPPDETKQLPDIHDATRFPRNYKLPEGRMPGEGDRERGRAHQSFA
jgi:hypothetical protein